MADVWRQPGERHSGRRMGEIHPSHENGSGLFLIAKQNGQSVRSSTSTVDKLCQITTYVAGRHFIRLASNGSNSRSSGLRLAMSGFSHRR